MESWRLSMNRRLYLNNEYVYRPRTPNRASISSTGAKRYAPTISFLWSFQMNRCR